MTAHMEISAPTAPPAGCASRGIRLSKLQKFMLDKARENRANEGRTCDQHGGADLYTWEVLAGFYGFETRQPKDGHRPLHGNVRRTSHNAAHIRCAEAAISRAARRLEERGLIVRCGGTSKSAGVRLTSAAAVKNMLTV